MTIKNKKEYTLLPRMDIELLQQIGLNKSEVKVYLTLLELGSSTTGPLMSKAKISSSKIYGVLTRLIEKGLVSFVIKENTKYYQASSPDSLLDYLDERESNLKKQKKEIQSLIPKLKLKQAMVETRQEAQVYVGWKGIMNAFNFVLDNLDKGDDYLAFAQTQLEEESKQAKLFFSQYQRKREEKRLNVKLIADIYQKHIFNSEPYNKFKNFKVRFVKNCPSGIIIFKDYILISAFDKSLLGVIINSKQIADSFRKYFYDMWKRGEKG